MQVEGFSFLYLGIFGITDFPFLVSMYSSQRKRHIKLKIATHYLNRTFSATGFTSTLSPAFPPIP